MREPNRQISRQAIQRERLSAAAMSLILLILALFVAAAASRIPSYLAAADYARLGGTILFALLVLIGLVYNLKTHYCLWTLLKNEDLEEN